jgi:hypothetical protein
VHSTLGKIADHLGDEVQSGSSAIQIKGRLYVEIVWMSVGRHRIGSQCIDNAKRSV